MQKIQIFLILLAGVLLTVIDLGVGFSFNGDTVPCKGVFTKYNDRNEKSELLKYLFSLNTGKCDRVSKNER